MERMKSFLKTSLLGGFAVILPITVSIFIFKWIFSFVIQLIHPHLEAFHSGKTKQVKYNPYGKETKAK